MPYDDAKRPIRCGRTCCCRRLVAHNASPVGADQTYAVLETDHKLTTGQQHGMPRVRQLGRQTNLSHDTAELRELV